MTIINAHSIINGQVYLCDSNKRQSSVTIPACVLFAIETSSEVRCTMKIKFKSSGQVVFHYSLQGGFQETSWRGHGIQFNEDIELLFENFYMSDGSINYRIFSQDLYSAYSQQFTKELDEELKK